MAGCEWRCRCRAGMTGCLLGGAGRVGGRVMGCPGRCLMLPGAVGGLRGWAGWRRRAGVWGMGGFLAGGMVRGGRWCGRMR
jgi:hypothetical protein